jgi:hypothetical protein
MIVNKMVITSDGGYRGNKTIDLKKALSMMLFELSLCSRMF